MTRANWRNLIPPCLHEIKMCLSNYSPTQKSEAHITVNSTQSKSSRQTGGNALKTQTERSDMDVRDLEELCRKTHTKSTHSLLVWKEQKINKRTTKHRKNSRTFIDINITLDALQNQTLHYCANPSTGAVCNLCTAELKNKPQLISRT